MGYWIEKLDKLNPSMCRLCAREPGKRKSPLTNQDIANRSGLSLRRVRFISKLKTWADITLREQEQFKIGCGLVLGRECFERGYLARTFNKQKVKSGSLFHIRKLLRMNPDPRLKAYIIGLMAQ